MKSGDSEEIREKMLLRTAPSDEGAVIFGITKNDWGRDNETSKFVFHPLSLRHLLRKCHLPLEGGGFSPQAKRRKEFNE